MQLIDDDDIDLTQYMADPEGNKILPANNWIDEVIDHFHGPVENHYGPKLPWKKTMNVFEFREGETTVIAGINGHGKSQIWNQVILDLLCQGERVCLASLEMKPHRTMVRMARQAAGTAEPAIPFLKQMGKWSDDRLWLYDKVGQCKPATMIAVIRYAVDKFNIKHFVLDNLTKIIDGEDNFSAQKDFVNALCAVAADLNIHIHLVMHVRKGTNEDDVPNKMSVKGAGSVTDMVDNLFIVWRNKAKERKQRAGDVSKASEPDALLLLEKQRNGDGEQSEGTYMLWYDVYSQQYIEDRDGPKKQYKEVTASALELYSL